MAILKYVKSTNAVNGADKYHLYKNSISDVLPDADPIATQNILVDFPYRGAIGKDGGEVSTTAPFQYFLGGSDKAFIRPLRRITENGAQYYFAITADLTASMGGGAVTPITISGEYNLPQSDFLTDEHLYIYGAKDYKNWFEEREDGWYMALYVEQTYGEKKIFTFWVRVADKEDYIKDIGFGKGQGYVYVTNKTLYNNRAHTEYIPLNLLGDRWGVQGLASPMCVGRFNLFDDNSYYKMAFYDANMKFIAGADNIVLQEFVIDDDEENVYFYRSGSDYYFTKAAIDDIAASLSTPLGKSAEFVVFSSAIGTSEKNYVSVPYACFPLFAMQDKFAEGEHCYLYATADSDSEYFKESRVSNFERYEVPIATS